MLDIYYYKEIFEKEAVFVTQDNIGDVARWCNGYITKCGKSKILHYPVDMGCDSKSLWDNHWLIRDEFGTYSDSREKPVNEIDEYAYSKGYIDGKLGISDGEKEEVLDWRNQEKCIEQKYKEVLVKYDKLREILKTIEKQYTLENVEFADTQKKFIAENIKEFCKV